MRFAYLSCAFVCASTAASWGLAAQTQTLNPVADTFVAASNPNNNYGGAGALAISAAGLPQGEFQSVMRFDLTAAKSSFDATFGAGNWQITGASLKLNVTAPSNGLFNDNVNGAFAINWMQDDSWIEGTGQPNTPTQNGVMFSTLPGFLAAGEAWLGTFAFAGATTTNSLTLATSFKTDVQSGGLVSLHLLAADSAVSYLFNSRTFQTLANRPELAVTADAIPEPASIAVMGCLFPLFRRPRRK